jgi:DNA-binding CsgD family transcriptional regulator
MALPFETVEDLVAAGHAALARAQWAEARERFEAAVAGDASAEALEGLSRATWWLGDEEATFSVRERAYKGYRSAGDLVGAARMAMWIASDHLDFHGDDAVASAWLQRGRSLLDGHEPSAEEGYLVALQGDVALLARSDPATAQLRAREALDIGRRIPDTGVEAVALAILGWSLIACGDADEGLAELERSVALAVGEDFEETAAPGWALCHTVSACADVGDFARAEQWCRALHTWSAEWRARHFFGVCRTAYGEVLATGGDWSSAEQELLSAIADLRTTRAALAGPAAVRLGRLRVRQGKPADARALFEAALPLPQATIALGELALAAGDARAAVDAADRVLRQLGDASVLDRFGALELSARARAACGDHAGAQSSVDQLMRDAARLATPYMRGRAQLASSHVLTAAGSHERARQVAEDAVDLFGACSAPYETAQARTVLSSALQALGHAERAAAEAEAARAGFALLGATDATAETSELSAREAEILRMVAEGLGDAQIAERLFLSPHTVHRHVANIRTKLGVPSRAAAVAHATRLGLV